MDERLDTKIFPRTKQEIKERILLIESKLAKNTEELKHIAENQDGDTMDDNNMRQLRTERELLEGELIELNRLVISEVYKREDFRSFERVAPGSLVVLRIQYPDATTEEGTFTVVSGKEAKYFNHESGDDLRIISSKTPIGLAIVGKQLGDSTEFLAPDGVGRVKIISIEFSEYLMSLEQ